LIVKKLFSHQEAAVTYGLNVQNPALFMEMRLGKSLTVIRICILRELKKVLVVAPKTTLVGWEDELLEEGMRRVRYLQPRNAKERDLLPYTDWGLVSFRYFSNHIERIEAMGWDAIVVDESTALKNPSTALVKKLRKRFRNSVRFILSGFPAPEDPMEYVEQFCFLNGDFLGCRNYWDFRKKYCTPPRFGYEWELSLVGRRKIKEAVAEDAFVMTREEAGFTLERVYEKRILPQTKNQRKAVKGLFKNFEYKGHLTKWRVVTATWAAQLAGGIWKGVHYSQAKINELKSLLEGELRDEKVVVYFRFNDEISLAEKVLAKAGIRTRTITGGTGRKERDQILRDYRYGNEDRTIPRVVLAQIKCVRFGVNFSACSTAIYYSNSFSMEERIQSEERIVHLRKQEPVLCVDLVVEDSMDEEILDALKEKRLDASDFLETALNNLRGKI
jgi:SNF2 family DNA or RNA helicase